ncbi:MAG: RDD family protein [Corallococcus sp.]|nr:RDD family protein [Bacillota bacterium]MCM1533727.1 RDD family protein [Corallococcus sp.]
MIYDLQKASILKRISAFLLDFILIAILATGFGALLSVIVDFNGCYDGIVEYEEEYKAHGIDTLLVTEELFDTLPEESQQYYLSVQQKVYALVYRCIMLIFLIVSLSLFFAYLVLEFIIPLLLKNGQTVGKKVFSIGVMQVNGVKLKHVSLFVRAILGKYTIETMVPVAIVFVFIFFEPSIVMLIVIIAIAVLQIVLFFATKTFSLIHDVLSSSVVVDMQSQMIFESADAMIAYKEELHRQEAEKAEYK